MNLSQVGAPDATPVRRIKKPGSPWKRQPATDCQGNKFFKIAPAGDGEPNFIRLSRKFSRHTSKLVSEGSAQNGRSAVLEMMSCLVPKELLDYARYKFVSDALIRENFHRKVLARCHSAPDMLVIDEPGLIHGKGRADIAMSRD